MSSFFLFFFLQLRIIVLCIHCNINCMRAQLVQDDCSRDLMSTCENIGSLLLKQLTLHFEQKLFFHDCTVRARINRP